MKRHVATFLMVLGWLVYGAMPAAACPMCDQHMRSDMEDDAMHSMAAMAMPGVPIVDRSAVDHRQDHDRGDIPCPGATHLSSCANCLVVVPVIAAEAGRPPVFSYPKPERARELRGHRPAPTPPPPRSA